MTEKSKFTIQEAPVELVREFWSTSRQAVLFNNPGVLTRISAKHSWWVALKGQEPIMVWPVHFGLDNKPDIPPFAYFFGPMWSPSAEARSSSSMFADRLSAYTEMSQFLIASFGGLANSFHDSLTDIRAFSWWGHETGLNFRVEPRFTARITELQSKPRAALLSSFRAVRRQEISKIERNGQHNLETAIPETMFIDFYTSTFQRQGQVPNGIDLAAIPSLLSLASDGRGFAIGARNIQTQELESLALVLVEGSTANLILNLTQPESRTSGVGSWMVYSSIEIARAMSADSFDFNGANSPRRADDKHSYGATEVLYFDVGYVGDSG